MVHVNKNILFLVPTWWLNGKFSCWNLSNTVLNFTVLYLWPLFKWGKGIPTSHPLKCILHKQHLWCITLVSSEFSSLAQLTWRKIFHLKNCTFFLVFSENGSSLRSVGEGWEIQQETSSRCSARREGHKFWSCKIQFSNSLSNSVKDSPKAVYKRRTCLPCLSDRIKNAGEIRRQWWCLSVIWKSDTQKWSGPKII